MDVYIGTPPKHYSLILDTGSDLNWIQCTPCHDCFEQNGPHYNPLQSNSYRNISCHDPRCQLVSSPDPPQTCDSGSSNQTCPYYDWYGDNSNTTGDFSLETFTVNVTTPTGASEFKAAENVMFGCGHWNRGLFHGASGLLGLGRGPLSFSSQLQSVYGHTFSYCLVDRNSDLSVSSKLIFGEDPSLLSHPNLNYTTLVSAAGNDKEASSVDTFYYVEIKGIRVGDEVLEIPAATWELSEQGAGGTIIDSGTTLSYFADPAYEMIRKAFVKQIKEYPLVKDSLVLAPCYNVSGVKQIELPEFAILFKDGAVWDFPVENYFIRLDPEEMTFKRRRRCSFGNNNSNSMYRILRVLLLQSLFLLCTAAKSYFQVNRSIDTTSLSLNRAYALVETYLNPKSSKAAKRIKCQLPQEGKKLIFSMDDYEEIVDEFRGIKIWWYLHRKDVKHQYATERRQLRLKFHYKHRETIMNDYLDHVIREGNTMSQESRRLKLYSNNANTGRFQHYPSLWSHGVFDHPVTFDHLAMDPEKKKEIINDLIAYP
ncbi:hypothetical protein C5167_012568 [Papaver somniferum]|uniref:Peptidase A1 domain-containing protein n=1 Tax=Papaver somniferum TaxID=3469 RepID=A0A4Y7IXV1_PAPSO|nr:hypothetical protein C5167_012568 [Papaver somniferum]